MKYKNYKYRCQVKFFGNHRLNNFSILFIAKRKTDAIWIDTALSVNMKMQEKKKNTGATEGRPG